MVDSVQSSRIRFLRIIIIQKSFDRRLTFGCHDLFICISHIGNSTLNSTFSSKAIHFRKIQQKWSYFQFLPFAQELPSKYQVYLGSILPEKILDILVHSSFCQFWALNELEIQENYSKFDPWFRGPEHPPENRATFGPKNVSKNFNRFSTGSRGKIWKFVGRSPF